MSNAYLINKNEKVVFEVWVGRITKEEFFAHDRKLLNDPELPPGSSVLVDITGASFDEIGEAGFEELVRLYREHRDRTAGAKVAIVASKNFQRAKMYESKTAPALLNVIVFNEMNHACTWLGVNKKEAQEWIDSKRAELISSSAA